MSSTPRPKSPAAATTTASPPALDSAATETPAAATEARSTTANEPSESAPPAPPAQAHRDPKVQALSAMFPQIDAEIIASVLASTGGNEERALETLLQLNDPDYKPEASVSDPQLDADEQLARSLQATDLEDQRQRALDQQQQQQQYANVPYAVRQARSRTPTSALAYEAQQYGGAQAQQPAREGPSEFEETFQKLADSGKKTFNDFLTKAKEAVNKFQQNTAGSGPGDGTSSGSGGSHPEPPYASSVAFRPSNAPPPPAQPYSFQPQAQTQQQQHPRSSPSHVPAPAPAPPFQSQTQSQSRALPTSSPLGTPSGQKDYTHLGFLPKKEINLRQQQPSSRLDDDDDDDLEYTNSPFDDRR